MSVRNLTKYRCHLALDPDEWPGEWEDVLNGFPSLSVNRRACFEFERETSAIILGPDVRLVGEVIGFLSLILSRHVSVPNGGLIFLDESGQVFKTNWELGECWDWQYVLLRIKTEKLFLQCFGATGAIVEFRHLGKDIQVQHLDYEHPTRIEGSREDLQGVLLRDEEHFADEVEGVLEYLQALSVFAAQSGQTASFANAFGLPFT